MAAHTLIDSIHSYPRGDWKRVGRDKYCDKMMDIKIEENWDQEICSLRGEGVSEYNTVFVL